MRSLGLLLILQTIEILGTSLRSHVQAMAGERITLTCLIDKTTCGPYHSVKWYKGTKRVFVYSPSGQFRHAEGSLANRAGMTLDEERAFLTFAPVLPSDEGDYKCEITYLDVNRDCPVVQVTEVETLAMPQYVNISLISEDGGSRTVTNTLIGPYNEGSQVILVCEAGGGKPTPKVSWHLNSETLLGKESSVEHANLTGTSKNKIEITVSRHHLGKRIHCVVRNAALDSNLKKTLSVWVQLDVNLRPRRTHVIIEGEEFREGRPASLLCTSEGARPAATLAWYNGTSMLENKTERNEASLQPDGTYTTSSRLVFSATGYDNNIVIRCLSYNDVLEHFMEGPQVAEAEVTVNYPPKVSAVKSLIAVKEGNSFKVECEFASLPAEILSVEWWRDEIKLNTTEERMKVSVENSRPPGTGTVSLTVNLVSPKDSGNYYCRLSNRIGSGKSKMGLGTQVDVLTIPSVSLRMDPPGPIVEGGRKNVTLFCDVSAGNPSVLTAVRWYMDSHFLRELPECNQKLISDLCDIDPSKLLLEEVSRHFHGNFSCIGLNAAGESLMSNMVQLQVHYPPGKAKVMKQEQTVFKGGSVVLNCTIEDFGRPSVTSYVWWEGESEVVGEIEIERTVNPVTLSSRGEVSCAGVNSAGRGEKGRHYVNASAPPNFLQNLPPYTGHTGKEGEITLVCQVECFPLCQIGWYRNGSYIKNQTGLYSILNEKVAPDFLTGSFESIRSSLVFNLSSWPISKEPRGEEDNSEFSCQSTANCIHGVDAGSHFHCEGVKSFTKFRLEFPPESVELRIPSRVIQVEEGQMPGRIQCAATAFPLPTFSWRFQGQEIQIGPVLELGPLSRDQSGLYTCYIENRHGMKKASVRLEIVYRPHCRVTQEKHGDLMLLRCEAEGQPANLTFLWSKQDGNDNRNLTPSSARRTLDQSQSFLQLEPIKESIGTFSCQAENSVGAGNTCLTTVQLSSLGITNYITTADTIAVVVAGVVVFLGILVAVFIILCRRHVNLREKFSPLSAYTQKNHLSTNSKSESNGNHNGTKQLSPSSPPQHTDILSYNPARGVPLPGLTGGITENRMPSSYRTMKNSSQYCRTSSRNHNLLAQEISSPYHS